MKSYTITEIHQQTKAVFGDRFPAHAVINFSRWTVCSSLGVNGIKTLIAKIGTRDIVILGNFVNSLGAKKTIDELIETKVPAVRGSAEDTLIHLDDAINRANEEDILFYGSILFNTLNGNDIIFSYNPKAGPIDLSYEALGNSKSFINDVVALVKSTIPDDHMAWLKALPTAFLFTDVNTRTNWNEGYAIIMSHGGSLSFEDDPVTLNVTPTKACWNTYGGHRVPSAAWIPYLLFPDQIKKKYIRNYDIYGRSDVQSDFCPSIHIGGVHVPWPSIIVPEEECHVLSLGRDIRDFAESKSSSDRTTHLR
jgi:hypothetical protein